LRHRDSTMNALHRIQCQTEYLSDEPSIDILLHPAEWNEGGFSLQIYMAARHEDLLLATDIIASLVKLWGS